MADERDRNWRVPTLAAFALTAILMTIALLSFEEETIHLKPTQLPASIQRCNDDAECVLVDQIGCCPCKSGGSRGAIAVTASDELRRFLKRTCRGRAVCVRVDTCHYDLVPACVAGRCVVRVGHG